MSKRILSFFLAMAITLFYFTFDILPVSASDAETSTDVIMTRPLADYLGFTHTSGKYYFGEEDFMNEGADRLLQMGSKTIKLWLSYDLVTTYPYNSTWPATGKAEAGSPKSLLDVIQLPYYQEVLAKPFTTYVFEAIEFGSVKPDGSYETTTNWKDGLSDTEKTYVKKQFYDLTKYLMETFRNTQRTFILQNWEGDNALRAWETPAEQLPTAIQGMTDWLNARQDGINQARNELQANGVSGVTVAGCVEITRINSSSEHFDHKLMVDEIVPYTYADLYSLSTWGTRLPGEERELFEKLKYYADQAPDTGIYGSSNIILGEYGAYETTYSRYQTNPELNYEQYSDRSLPDYTIGELSGMAQLAANRKQVENGLQIGVQFALNWELYCNGLRDGITADKMRTDERGYKVADQEQLKGVWVIRPDGSLTPTWYYFLNLFNPKSINDYLNSWSFTDSRTSNLTFAADHADTIAEGDTSRVVNGSTSNGTMVYKLAYPINDFSAKVYYKNSTHGKIKLYTSIDGLQWTQSNTVNTTPIVVSADGWKGAFVKPAAGSIPQGSRYLKIELSAQSAGELQLSGVTVNSEEADQDVNVKYYKPIELTGIKVDGKSIENTDSSMLLKYPYTYSTAGQPKAIFDPTVIGYAVRYPAGTTAVPKIDAVVNDPNLNIEITPAVSLPGTTYIKASAKDGRILTYRVEFIPAVTGDLHSADTLKAGENVEVSFGLKNVSESANGISGMDVSFQYDTNVFDYTDAQSVVEGTPVIQTDNRTSGVVRLLTASLGADQAIPEDGDVIKVTFRVKADSQASRITLSKGIVADRGGNTWTVYPSSVDIIPTPTSTPTPTPEPTPTPTPTPEPTSTPDPVQDKGNHDKKEQGKGGTTTVTLEKAPVLDKVTGIAQATIDTQSLQRAVEQAKAENRSALRTVSIEIPEVEGAKAYETVLPASLVTSDGKTSPKVEVKTGVATIVLPSDMLKTQNTPGKESHVALTIAAADKTVLPPKTAAAIGDHPLIELNIKVDGKKISWNNPEAPVKVSIPYKPTAKELKNSHNIVIFYIDGSGAITTVPNGRYNPATGEVTFTTTHFSTFSISYVEKSFTDLAGVEWAKNAIEVLASKGIILGTHESTFMPNANISRADFLFMLVKSLGLSAEVDDNFSDVKREDYYYEALGIAKKLGISQGIGNNLFNPKEEISRQELMTLTARAMKQAGILEATGSRAALKKFTDTGRIADYALESIAALVQAEVVKGEGDFLNPLDSATRAETAVLMYRIYMK